MGSHPPLFKSGALPLGEPSNNLWRPVPCFALVLGEPHFSFFKTVKLTGGGGEIWTPVD